MEWRPGLPQKRSSSLARISDMIFTADLLASQTVTVPAEMSRSSTSKRLGHADRSSLALVPHVMKVFVLISLATD